ncbi:MAG: polysaccharide biosynthesis tyrosine autokinase [Thermodesulfobacteriota bacterium]
MKPRRFLGEEPPLLGRSHPELGPGTLRPYGTVTSEYIANGSSTLDHIVEVILRRKKVVMGVFLAAVFGAALWTFLAAPVYRARATIEIDKDAGISLSSILTSISPSIASGIDAVGNEDILTQMNIMKSRILAQRLADALKLHEIPEFRDRSLTEQIAGFLADTFPAALIDRTREASPKELEARERLLDRVMDRIQVVRDGRSRLMIVMIESQSPELAHKMLETYLDIYFAENLAKRNRANVQAAFWLVDEIKKAEAKAKSALDAVVAFAATHDTVSFEVNSPNAQANHKLAIFAKTAEDLVKTKETRILLESLYQVSGEGSLAFPNEFKFAELEPLVSKLADLEASYAEASKIYSENFPRLALLRGQIAMLKDRSVNAQRQIMSTMLASARQKEDLHEKALEEAKHEALKSNSLGVQYAILKKTAETTQEIYMLLLKKLKNVQLMTQAVGNNLLTVDPPTVPVKPVRPRKILNLLLGCLIGLFSGIACAFVAEAADTTVKSVEDVEHLDIPNLGSIPDARRYVPYLKNRSRDPIELLMSKQVRIPAVTEAIECVKTSLFLSFPESYYRSLLVTSAISGEGKTFVSVLLACAFSSQKSPVLLIEADLRRPRLHHILGHGEPPESGLSEIVARLRFHPARTIRRSKFPGLFYITSGSVPEYPSRLLDPTRLSKVLDTLKMYFPRIIIDAPPLVGLSDARILTNAADGTIIVVKRGYASLKVVQRAVVSLNSRNGHDPILGTVLNGAETTTQLGRRLRIY